MGTIGRPLLAMMLLVPLLAACAPAPNNAHPVGGLDMADMPMPAAAVASARADRTIAVTHRFTIRVPNADIEAMQQRHMTECAKLGCSILSTSIDRSNVGRASARASVRIKPDAFNTFAAALAATPAQIIMHAQSSEELAAPILDTERRLAAKTVIRDRLTAMLQDQTVKSAADLITIEKELAQAQAEIEAITAQRENLRTRTDTIRIDINYVGAAGLVGGMDLTPIDQSVSKIGETMVSSISALISTIAAVVPWLPFIALIWWGARRGLRRWRVRKLPG
ncbi:DUF4349 domain-containing protein [Bradyrhizobium jicamae]|uniref:DUF4349 domain-containing protein n=1 Tax=Bradyrhizobium jicamae TaxID=280332 RepID=UPI001BA69CD1|nr:DUF4349 domain-containing protein [Bradyrhizobium jicamae]MBR0758534.1 DUF4349 domain-containing protein [Bradyrhizobium jicamae]